MTARMGECGDMASRTALRHLQTSSVSPCDGPLSPVGLHAGCNRFPLRVPSDQPRHHENLIGIP